jgi:hypothetical protein
MPNWAKHRNWMPGYAGTRPGLADLLRRMRGLNIFGACCSGDLRRHVTCAM